MSEWAQAFGALGAVVMGAFGGANWRVPFLEKFRILGLGTGLLTWVLAGFAVPADGKPSWYEPLGASAMVIAGVAGTWRTWQRHRHDPESGDDDAVLAADAAGELRHFFERDDTAAIDAAVAGYRGAVRASAGSGPHLRHRTDLLKVLRIRYERLRDRADLDEAVLLGREAQAGRGPRRYRALLLTELSTALRLRYDHTGAAADLAEAKEYGAAAVALLHGRHLLFPLCSSRLSLVLHSWYEHTGDADHLDDALARLRAGIRSAALRGYIRTADDIRLCHLLAQRGRHRRAPADLVEALAVGRRTVERTTPTDPLYASCLHHLSIALRVAHDLLPPEEPHRGYRIRSADSRLEKAENHARRAVLRMNDEAPEGARYRLNHALVLYDLHRARPNPDRLEQALATARTAAGHPTADVPTRLRAGLVWSRIASAEGFHAEAVEAFESVVGLLPKLAPHELERQDQEQRIARWPGIAVAAATGALEAGDPDKAATLLEHGRGVLLSRALDLRTDLTALRAARPELADELAEVRQEIARAPAAAGRGRHADLVRRARRGQEERWEHLVRRIREVPGCEDFARTPTAERLRAQSAEGPVIYLNVTARRSDAIVVRPDGIRSVPLTITPAEVETRTRQLYSCLGPEAVRLPRDQGPAFSVLAWMWDALVSPALSAALPPPDPDAPPPRVWWVPTGPLAALPLHAAGHHRDGGPALIDRAVSSYTPTVRALAAARSRAGPPAAGGRLVVAMTDTPGAARLECAADEAALVSDGSPGATVLMDAEATRDRVLAELPRHAWAHFACHAVPDPRTPSRSRLLLHDHRHAPLTVADVSELDLRGSRGAYLSACETSVTGPEHRDEAIHLASAFQLSGYSHVVSTLWKLPDRGACRLAKVMYEELARAEEDGGADAATVARAVHATARRAREEMYPHLPGLWAALVHVGP